MKRIATTLFLAASLAYGASAQSLQTAYFLDNFIYSYQLNPASRPDNTTCFLGIGVDNISLGINSNVGLKSLVFPVTVDGRDKLVTGFNPEIQEKTFLDAIGDKIVLNGDLNENIFSFGFSRGDSFFTVEANLRADLAMNLPREFISLLKSGPDNTDRYHIGNMYSDASVYSELAMGYSHRITDMLSVGGRVKLLAGGARNSANAPDVKATVSDGASAYRNVQPESDDIIITSNSKSNGAVIDLGAEFRPLDGLTVSASANDLGGIFWRNRKEGSTSIEKFGTNDHLEMKPSSAEEFIGIGARFNGGLRYDVVKHLSFGIIGTVRTGHFGWAEARAGVTFTAWKVFSLAASAGVNSYGPCFGAAMSLKIPVVNFFFGIDSIPTRFTPQFVPLDRLHTRLNLGLVVAF